MSEAQFGTALLSLLSLVGLVVVVFHLYPQLRIDEFRQKAFALRDSMFDLAQDGKLSFSDEAYKRIRLVINGFIRDADRITILELAYWIAAYKTLPAEEQTAPMRSALSAADAEKRAVYQKILAQTHTLVLELACKRSLLLYGVCVVFALKAKIGEWFGGALGLIDLRAYRVGSSDCPPATT